MKLAAALCALALLIPAAALAQYGGANSNDRRGNDNRDRGGYQGNQGGNNQGGNNQGGYQGNDNRGGFGDNRGLPAGSWVATCRNAHADRGMLYAECQDSRGRYQPAQVNANGCAVQRVANVNGSLVCEPPSGGPGGMPGGSWTATCRGGHVMGTALMADCQDSRGRYRSAVLNIRTCASNRVANRDGGLVCE